MSRVEAGMAEHPFDLTGLNETLRWWPEWSRSGIVLTPLLIDGVCQ